MRHFLKIPTPRTAHPRRTTRSSATPWFWQVFGITTFICFGLASEGFTCHLSTISPTSLIYNAVQGATTLPNQTITVSRPGTDTVTLTASDNASWLSESPATTSMTTSKKLTATVNASGLTAGTRTAAITLKWATWCTATVPVTLILSPAGGGGGGTTSSATLTWNTVTGTVTGYKVYVGEAPSQYTRTINVGNVTSSTVNSLTVGRTYYFVVAAYNSAGESPPSNMASKTIQ